jgi:hypothetical protein
MSHMSHLYQISLSCVIGHQMCQCVTGDFLQLTFNDVRGGGREGDGGWGQKMLSKPSADSFAVGRRQKVRIDKKAKIDTYNYTF